MSSGGFIFFLDALSQLINKLMIITSYNMIKMGGVIQGELARSVLEISCHQLLLFTRESAFLFGTCTCIWHWILA